MIRDQLSEHHTIIWGHIPWGRRWSVIFPLSPVIRVKLVRHPKLLLESREEVCSKRPAGTAQNFSLVSTSLAAPRKTATHWHNLNYHQVFNFSLNGFVDGRHDGGIGGIYVMAILALHLITRAECIESRL